MLSGGPDNWNTSIRKRLSSPMRGCSRNSQPIAAAKPGMSRPIAIRVNSIVLARKSVRSAIQAIGIPNASAIDSEMKANANVSMRTV